MSCIPHVRGSLDQIPLVPDLTLFVTQCVSLKTSFSQKPDYKGGNLGSAPHKQPDYKDRQNYDKKGIGRGGGVCGYVLDWHLLSLK